MEILVLGGTGAMGVALVEQLKQEGHKITVTSRKERESTGNCRYLCGNAKEDAFIRTVLNHKYDAIVDFMVYSTEQFNNRVNLLLEHTDQYFYFSSSRVYAESEIPLTELASRLLDVCQDEEYLKTDEYALAKARGEDILTKSGYTNWTIIRPYITYNSERLQLGVYEKENWLYRALRGRTIVMPKDIADKETSLTYGGDVAKTVVRLIGNPKALGETFHIVTGEHKTWGEILEIYLDVIEKRIGKRPKVKFVDNSESLQQVWGKYQIKYDRLFNRIFDSSKVNAVCGKVEYKSIQEGLTQCLEEFLDSPQYRGISWTYEAWADKISGERTRLSEIIGKKAKVKYLLFRYFRPV